MHKRRRIVWRRPKCQTSRYLWSILKDWYLPADLKWRV